MTTKNENTLNSTEAVLLLLTNNVAVWSVIAAITVIFELLKAKVQLVRDLRQVQEKDNSGVTQRKANVRDEMEKKGMKLVKALKAHAVATNDVELQNSIDYTKSDLSQASDNRIADIIRLIFETAQPLTAILAGYQVTEDDIELMNTLHQQYILAIPERREKDAASSTATANIENLVKEIAALQRNKLDVLVATLEDTNPDFCQQYKNARKIIDRGVRHETSSDSPEVEK